MDKDRNEFKHLQQHQANERTFLAWLRTSVSFIGFGFVIEKFSFFIAQISQALTQTAKKVKVANMQDVQSYSSKLGLLIIALGIILAPLSYYVYKKTEKQIEEEVYTRYSKIDFLITLAIIVIGFLFLFHLLEAL